MAYQIHERCGCGATIDRAVYPLEKADQVLSDFRTTHRHIEPVVPAAAPRIALRGNPRIRASRIMRTTP